MAKKRDRREYLKAYREKNKDILKSKRVAKKEETAEYSREYRKKNRDKLNQYSLEWNRAHKEHLKEYNKNYAIKNKDRVAERRKNDLVYRTAINLRARFRMAVKNKCKSGSAIKDLGCPIDWFIWYIEQQFTFEMNWKNYGKVWTYDHIIPLSKFDLTKRDEVIKACHFSNIRPMLASENISKNNRSEKEYLESKRGI